MSAGSNIRQWLMTGVSYMIPFVAAGGILIALSFLISGDPAGFTSLNFQNALDGVDADGAALAMNVRIGAVFFSLAMGPWGFLIPALAGYIAFGIADRPGLVPGFAAGAFANTVGAGFLGGLIGGLIAGLVARWISNWTVPSWLRPLMPIVINPLVAVTITGLAMITLGKLIVTPLNTWATDSLNGLQGSSLIVLGIVIGLMMAFDMGGPVNKVAYGFGLASLTGVAAGQGTVVMAAVMAAGMTPPLGLALATVVRKSLFSDFEQEQGKAAFVLGLTFITEGAIPFAAADPARVIPSIMVGSATTGALVGAFGSTLSAPHGGIAVLPLIGSAPLFLAALVIGSVVTAAMVIVLKGIGAKAEVAA